MVMRRYRRLGLGVVCGLAAAMLAPTAAVQAGGVPENVLLIIDPSNTDSLYVGNYYKNARQVPDRNVIYMAPGAVDYPTFAQTSIDALFGSLANAAIDDHIDYVVVMPGAPFYVSTRI